MGCSDVLTLISHLGIESLQSFVNVLSEVGSDVEVGVNPTAARASASGINPVSTDTFFVLSEV